MDRAIVSVDPHVFPAEAAAHASLQNGILIGLVVFVGLTAVANYEHTDT